MTDLRTLHGSGRLSDVEVMANVYAWLGAGAETPASAISYTLYQLALHPESQERVIQVRFRYDH